MLSLTARLPIEGRKPLSYCRPQRGRRCESGFAFLPHLPAKTHLQRGTVCVKIKPEIALTPKGALWHERHDFRHDRQRQHPP